MIDVDAVTREVLKSKKYRHVLPDTIRRLCMFELRRGANEKHTTKAVKTMLHRISGAFIPDNCHRRAAEIINGMPENPGTEELLGYCRELLGLHVSTAERLDDYPFLYRKILEVTGRPESILDVACGFNPFSLPLLDPDRIACYRAADINLDTVGLVNAFFKKCGYRGEAFARDALEDISDNGCSVVFLFKLLPILEQQGKGNSARLMQSLRADFCAVTFPAASIGGRKKGMECHYSRFFESIIEIPVRILTRFRTSGELVYVTGRR